MVINKDSILHKPELLKILNTRKILRMIQKNEGISRAQISRKSGMSRPTVSAGVRKLLNLNLVKEIGKFSKNVGRKGQGLALNTSSVWIMGILIGIKDSMIFSSNLRGEINAGKMNFRTTDNYEIFFENLINTMENVLNKTPYLPLGCAVSMPGMCNDRTGEIYFSPNLQFLNGKNIVKRIQEKFQISTIQIQEIRSIAFGALHNGSQTDDQNIICVEIDEGVGGSIVLNGEIYEGSQYASGELGHIQIFENERICGCGQWGCLETLIGLRGLHQSWKEKFRTKENISHFFEVCQKKPQEAAEIFLEALPYFANILKSIVQLFDPQKIILHGKIWELIPQSIEDLKKQVDFESLLEYRSDAKRRGLVAGIFQRIIMEQMVN